MKPNWSFVDYVNWYKLKAVKFNMIKFTQNRESAFLVPYWVKDGSIKRSCRCKIMHSTDHVDFLFNRSLRIWEQRTLYNVYHSLGKYEGGLPKVNWEDRESYRKEKAEWKETHWKKMIGYDWLIDIDAKSHDHIGEALKQAKTLQLLFNKLGVPYRLVFSGMGFHFIIPYDKIENKCFDPADTDSVFQYCYDRSKLLKEYFYLDLLDMKVYDSRRLCKTPYSLSLYEDRFYVCVVLNTLEDFKLSNFTPYAVFHRIHLMGDFIHNPDGTLYKLEKYLEALNGKTWKPR